jgi:hypothetical protein
LFLSEFFEVFLPFDNGAAVSKLAYLFLAKFDEIGSGEDVVVGSTNRLANGCFVRFLHTSNIPFLNFFTDSRSSVSLEALLAPVPPAANALLPPGRKQAKPQQDTVLPLPVIMG